MSAYEYGAKRQQFSVLMPVYKKDSPDHFRIALQSIAQQSLPADQIVIVEDGPLTDGLYQVIADFKQGFEAGRVVTVRLATNQGLGLALAEGVRHCDHELIARMDADDVCVPERFACQLDFLATNPDVAMVGSFIKEFESDVAEEGHYRLVPTSHAEIVKFAKYRNPMNHMTVMFRKQAVLAAGNYQSHHSFEDYRLWVALIAKGYVLANIPMALVNARVGNGLFGRRRGGKYLVSEWDLLGHFRRIGFLRWHEYLFNMALKTAIRLVPVNCLAVLYRHSLRQRKAG